MNKFSFFIVVFLSFAFLSCSSVRIPGEKKRISENVSAEYYNIAVSYEDLKKYSKAIEYYELASNGKNLKENCAYRIARCHALNKDWENAEKCYAALLKKDAENLNLKVSLAYIYAMNGSPEKAEEIYAGLYEPNCLELSVLKNYTAVLIALDKTEKAAEIFSVLKENYPQDESIEKFEKVLLKEDYKADTPEEEAR